ncbi:MAG: hypothetical protein K9M81_04765 [Chthoniobacterales bacterium]|nr:hypothetical protein [Chthoniobacterales bacterium]
MKIKCSLLAILVVFTTMHVQNALAQSAPSPSNPQHAEIDKQIAGFSDAIDKYLDKVEIIGETDSNNNIISGYYYIPSAGAICDVKTNGVSVSVKKNEFINVLLSSISSTSQWSLTQTDPSVALKLQVVHHETNEKFWNDYSDEPLISNSSITPQYKRVDSFFFKAPKIGSTTLTFTISTPSTQDPTKTINKKVYINIDVTE